ncbi:MAG: phosphoribosyltransferase family protein [bacterium]|nr:phosphoribosyltransferase family protein [bacterium]
MAPPRPTLRVVRSLTLPALRAITLRGDNAGALPYHDPRVRALVWELKYHANPTASALAGELVAEVLIGIASEELGKPLLVPMPMHAARRRERGHNQAELLCEAALRCMEDPMEILPLVRSGPLGRSIHSLQEFPWGPFYYAPNVLVRERATPPQQGLAKHRRLTNVKNSMRAVYPERVRGRMCVVLDDVSTTGASLAEARRALLAAGAREVECVALAHS